MEWINLLEGPTAMAQVTYGPVQVDPQVVDGLWLLTRGLAEVDVGSDDPSANFLPGPGIVPGSPFDDARFDFLWGKSEEISEYQHFVDAVPLTGGEFSYSVEIQVSATYV